MSQGTDDRLRATSGTREAAQPLVIGQVAASLARSDGGPATGSIELNRAMRRLGAKSRIWTTDAAGSSAKVSPAERRDLVSDQGTEVHLFRVHAPRRLKASLPMALALHDAAPALDIVHIHGLYLCHTLAAARAASQAGIPYVLQPHGSLEPYQRRKSRRAKAVYDRMCGTKILQEASAVIFADESEAEGASDVVPSGRSFVNPLGARLNALQPDYVPSWWRPEFKRGIIFLGRIAAKKRVDLLIRSMPLILKKDPTLRLVIAAPLVPGLAEEMQRLAENSSAADAIVFVGEVDEAEKSYLLQHGLVFALPSENENFAISVAEAFQASLPVVTTDQVATHRYVRKYGAGLVLEQCSPEALADAILSCSTSPSALAAYRKGSAAAASELTWEASARRLLGLYEMLRSA